MIHTNRICWNSVTPHLSTSRFAGLSASDIIKKKIEEKLKKDENECVISLDHKEPKFIACLELMSKLNESRVLTYQGYECGFMVKIWDVTSLYEVLKMMEL